MALIVRIDVDRPYGRNPVARHVLSRLRSDLYFPRLEALGYLRELAVVLEVLNRLKARAYVFFRRCTLPSSCILRLIASGKHEIGLHLENSRSYTSFIGEKRTLERHIGRPVSALSKHGSGELRAGLRHYPPYQPDLYVQWARRSEMTLLLGNLEDPSLDPVQDVAGFRFYPAAFWLEPSWRNTEKFTVDWLRGRAASRDVALLVHPENILADAALFAEFEGLVHSLETRIFE